VLWLGLRAFVSFLCLVTVVFAVGRINTLIYPVEGGMEDWMYAAGWDKATLRPCAGDNTNIGARRRLMADDSVERDKHRNAVVAVRTEMPAVRESVAVNVATVTVPNKHSAGESAPYRRHLQNAAAENRAVVFLVETSDRKRPLDSTLGGSEKVRFLAHWLNWNCADGSVLSVQILDPNSPENGHVPRNVRLSLAAIDMVQPYVCLSKVATRREANGGTKLARRHLQLELVETKRPVEEHSNDETVSNHRFDERTVSTESNNATSLNTRGVLRGALEIPAAQAATSRIGAIEVEWYVGGAQTVDCTFLAWHKAPVQSDGNISTVNWSAYLSSLDTPDQLERFSKHCRRSAKEFSAAGTLLASFPVVASAPQTGMSRWYASNASTGDSSATGDDLYAASDPLNPKSRFRASVSLSSGGSRFSPGRYLLVTWAMVDQNFGSPKQGYPVDAVPQSHLANARTNPAYHKKVGDRAVLGRVFWPSDPVAVVVAENGTVWVESAVTHCAWWDRRYSDGTTAQIGGDDFGTGKHSSTKIGGEYDPVAYVPGGELRNSAHKLFVITLGLLLITGMCCVCLYYHWRRGAIYAQLAGNKYVNFSTFQHYRSRGGATSTIPSSTIV
jgi:hypothetical protein